MEPDAEIVVVEDQATYAGASTRVEPEEIERLAPEALGDVLRRVPGLHVLPEDGGGLFLNLGVRGLPPARSSRVLVLEDGVPIAPGPYGHPELYWVPPVGRVHAVDVVRGSGTVRYGPQTVGGVVDLRSPPLPEGPVGSAEARVGAWELWQGRASGGTGGATAGWRLDAEHRRYGGPRGIDLVATDVAAKAGVELGATETIVRFSWSEEVARPSYLGLTTAQFEADPTQNLAVNDRFELHRPAGSVATRITLGPAADLHVLAYGQQIARSWARQDWERSEDGADVILADSNNQRDRLYAFGGLQPEVLLRPALPGKARLELRAGARAHHEHERQRQLAGATATARSGVLTSDEVLTGDALAAWTEADLGLGDAVRITAGLRGESFWSGREVWVTPGDDPDTGEPVGVPTDVEAHRWIGALLPGIGTSWAVTPALHLWAGGHRGWSPPSTTDAIDADGTVLTLEAEDAWNQEAGVRVLDGRRLHLEVTGFWMAFRNQVLAPDEAGVASTDERVNGEPTRHLGVEVDARSDLLAATGGAWHLEPFARYTLVDARYTGGTFAGNVLPYAPHHLAHVGLLVVAPGELTLQGLVSWVGAQYADAANTEVATVDGTNGRMGPGLGVDVTAGAPIPLRGGHTLRLQVVGRNLTHTVTIGSRAPAGIQPVGFRGGEVALSGEW